ncbi:heterogeneous nuclear ribonucleoprotein Q [Musa acuminata AAA Group]|uniref:RRM domain-containing protein n=1 Tax=Musa acuminata subsp. malaccensis TaxID=214687 RepID=A0A804KU20_MUSAM|nr:PREDICTED: heterogeneous nuclear ribonucleoprotein R [Musa acuminata subsp. malaccensis]XP_009420809.1 PREDICTED: heterogeneous nuclear ribonucleoprotein R [Musa acuminata subsp. malaccensis]XP_009420810.1 PREDICTED: heterogeneous nuclear ribonucleoprotein R [Musa acuminata subsp. malaccensis]
MAERQQLVEPEEQVDLDGDNDIEEEEEEEDMMDDEDPVEEEEDNGYQKAREEFGEEDEEERSYGADDDNDEDGAGDGRSEKVPTLEGVNDDAPEAVEGGGGQEEEVEKQVEAEDDEDSRKRAKLLALPPHGSEVFIGGLPRDASEEDLRELAEPFGDIYEVRVMKDKDTKESKGFAFIMFTNSDAAQKAIEGIHEREFKGRKLRCSLSQAKHRLFIGNVPKSLAEDELRKILEDSGPGVEHIEMFKDPQNPARNRGFLFVEYYNHACAEYARQKMTNSNFKIDGTNPTVSWADPKNSADSSAAAQVKAIYVKNLPENVSSERLKELFELNGEVTKVVLPPAKAGQGKRDFGFVHFADRSSALKAVKATEKFEIDGHVLEVSLAKPQADKKPEHAAKPGLIPNLPSYPPYGYSGDPYGAYGGGYGAAGFGQPMIYGRGPMPPGMRMVPMMLPDGRLGYVLQQPGAQPSPPPPPRRGDRSGGSSESGSRGSDGNRGRRYRPY